MPAQVAINPPGQSPEQERDEHDPSKPPRLAQLQAHGRDLLGSIDLDPHEFKQEGDHFVALKIPASMISATAVARTSKARVVQISDPPCSLEICSSRRTPCDQ